MAPSPSSRTKVFISYSHADKDLLDRLQRHLKPLVREGRLDCWDDTHIRSGDDWQQEIRTALDTAQAAVLLISADFFASDFIDESELPPLLAAAQAEGVRILPVILSACRFARDPSLARFQAVNPPDRPLDGTPRAEQEKVLDSLARTIEGMVTSGWEPEGPLPRRTTVLGPRRSVAAPDAIFSAPRMRRKAIIRADLLASIKKGLVDLSGARADTAPAILTLLGPVSRSPLGSSACWLR